jgi:hypothetical protein
MTAGLDLAKLRGKAKLKDRYVKQLRRLQAKKIETGCIEKAVDGVLSNLAIDRTASLVVYGEPQSGKTEMMICLTAKLLDRGHSTIVHLMNDSVDLLGQNLRRFKTAGLAPAPRSLSEILQSSDAKNPQELVVFCKKNTHDLDKLIERVEGKNKIVVIDDEADYATPNSKINKGTKTRINELVGNLIGDEGCYVGVTATPARLDLNATFDNDSDQWVYFPPHEKYTGQDVFFPMDRKKKLVYRLKLLSQAGSPDEARDALVRFLVTVAYLNSYVNKTKEENYTMLVHTSGRREDHEADRVKIEESVHALIDSEGVSFTALANRVHRAAQELYPNADPQLLTEYVVETASRASLIVLNSKRDRKTLGDNATEPSSPFTVIIGGNIVSRGVTFPNLLSLFFTRHVKHRLQQDTYIQRARMFGARGKYLKHFELTIPSQLYADWRSCFVFHRLALETVKNKLGSPVWIGNNRISVASAPSIKEATVTFDKREMGFGIFGYSADLDDIVLQDQTNVNTLKKLKKRIGNDALPKFLIDYIEDDAGSLAIHIASTIENYGPSADQITISREKGFMGKSQLEVGRFPNAVHHVKMFRNKAGKARVFYKSQEGLQLLQNRKGFVSPT